MKKSKILSLFLLTCALQAGEIYAAQAVDGRKSVKELREAVRLFDIGMIGRSKVILDDVVKETGTADSRGYALVCEIMAGTPGYEVRMERFLKECHYSI